MPRAERLHALDSLRGFALLLGVAFHAAISFVPGMIPGIWAIVDRSPSVLLSDAAFVSHIFRMSLFFFLAGFFARMLYQRDGARGFWVNRLKRVLVPLVAGWLVIFPAVAWVWSSGIRKAYGGAALPLPMPGPEVVGAFPLTHLWFLYYLLLLYAALLTARALFVRIDRSGHLTRLLQAGTDRLMRGYAANILLGLPLAACLLSLPMWVYWQGIPTPDHSLIPQLASFVGYGTALLAGWLVHRSSNALPDLRQRWYGHLLLAILASAACLWLLHTQAPLTPVEPGARRTMFVLAFVIALWSWVFGLTGASLRFFDNYSPARRYVADASYWIYIVHLPVVAALQVWVAHWPVHWALKYSFVLVASLALLFCSYHLLVRSTVIGQLLNGRKYRRGTQHAPTAAVIDAPRPTHVAELRQATKSYGRTKALDAVDLQIAHGGLTAVLGPNGAGKSTAISLMLGLIEPDGGTVHLLGGSPLAVELRRRLGVMMQSVELPRELRVRELVALAASYYPNPRTLEQTLKLTGTTDLADRSYGQLSEGQKRQVQFAMAVCGRPEILFLDEPTVGLDVRARRAMWSTIRELVHEGCSIVLTTHYLEEAEMLADRVIVLARSRVIASGTVDEIRSIVSRTHITCRTSIPVADICNWPGVVSALRDEAITRITAIDAEDVVRRLLAEDSQLRQLDVRQAGLHEAFDQLTKEAA